MVTYRSVEYLVDARLHVFALLLAHQQVHGVHVRARRQDLVDQH